MSVLDSLSHLKWRFTESNIKPTKKDIDSVNKLISYFNSREINESNSIYTYKLIVHFFRKMIIANSINNNYKEVDINIINNEIQKALNIDIEEHIKMLHHEINHIEIVKLINNNNLNTKTILNISNIGQTTRNIRKLLNNYREQYGIN